MRFNCVVMINKFLNILFPEVCPVCKKPSRDHKTAPICPECWQTISIYKGPSCQRCGKPLVSDVSITCGGCLEDEPFFVNARSAGLYEGVLREAINLFKYYSIKRLSKPLSEIMLLVRIPENIHVVVPVPLHKKRLGQREFNQSALLSKHIADYIGAKLMPGCLAKIKETRPQVGLSAKERRENIKGVLRITNEDLIKEKNIMLVDDVFTTGATIRECSKLLKRKGAANVYALALAHVIGD